MRKILSFLFGFVMLFSMISCYAVPETDHIFPTTESTDIPPAIESTDIPPKSEPTLPEIKDEESVVKGNVYDTVLITYRQVLSACDAFLTVEEKGVSLGKNGNPNPQLFQDLMERVRPAYLKFYDVRIRGREVFYHFGYSIKDLNGDGIDELVLMSDKGEIFAVFSNVRSQAQLVWLAEEGKECWIDSYGSIYTKEVTFLEYGMHTDYCIFRICRYGFREEQLAFGKRLLTVVGESAASAHPMWYQFVDGKKTAISETKYEQLLSEHFACFTEPESTESWDCLSSSFAPAFPSAYLAERALNAALDNRAMVYRKSSDNGEWLGTLLSAQTLNLYEGATPLSETSDLCYVFYDMDGDGAKEVFIECSGQALLLRYYQGAVYAYALSSGNSINSDGSYNCNFSMYSRGCCKLSFDGVEMKTTEIWRTVNDEGRIYYYLHGKSVSMQQWVNFFDENPTKKVFFDFLKRPWINKISRAKAIWIGWNYWNSVAGDSVVCIQKVDAPNSVYVIAFTSKETGYYGEIWVDKTTGSIFTWEDFYKPANISPEDALKIANEYWGNVDGMVDEAAGSYYVSKLEIMSCPTPQCPFYHIAWNVEHYRSGDFEQYEGYEDGRPHCVRLYEEVLVDIYTGECVPYIGSDFDGKG